MTEVTCTHGEGREPHPWQRPGCPERPVPLLVLSPALAASLPTTERR